MFRDKTLKNLRHRKRPSIQIIGIDEGEETEVKIRNVLNNNIEENFPIWRKECLSKSKRHQNTTSTGPERKFTPQHNIIKTQSVMNKKKNIQSGKEQRTNHILRKAP